MPHVRRSMLITIAAPAEHVRRACTRELDLAGGDDRYEGPLTGMPDTEAQMPLPTRMVFGGRVT